MLIETQTAEVTGNGPLPDKIFSEEFERCDEQGKEDENNG